MCLKELMKAGALFLVPSYHVGVLRLLAWPGMLSGAPNDVG